VIGFYGTVDERMVSRETTAERRVVVGETEAPALIIRHPSAAALFACKRCGLDLGPAGFGHFVAPVFAWVMKKSRGEYLVRAGRMSRRCGFGG
jgi:hypothetical protein